MSSSTMRFAGILTIAITCMGCATMHVNSYLAPDVNLRTHRSYTWSSSDSQFTGDPRLDNNRFFHERLRAAVDQQLAGRGFEKDTSGGLIVHYHASVSQEIYISGVERMDGYCEDCTPEVYDQGTIVIDFVDARTDRLVWRGWAEGSLDRVIDHQQWLEQRIDETVARILQTLPQDF